MSKKNYVLIITFVVLIAVIAFVVYTLQQPTQKYGVGVNVGDVFTYKITGVAEASVEDAPIPDGFMDINKIDYCRIEITKVEFPFVSYIETTQYLNGTSYEYSSTINLNTGVNTNSGGFWGIYVTGLTTNSLSRPDIPDCTRINSTESRTYLDGDRQTLFLRAENMYYDIDDETYSTICYEYTFIRIDKQIGILVEVIDRNVYTNPQIMLTITWELIDSNVLQVKQSS